jgi:heptosyltransferase-3
MHQVEMDYIIPKQVLGLPEEPPPIRFDVAATHPWRGAFNPEKEGFAILHAATRWESKAWPLERWREVLGRILEFTPRVIVSCGPGAAEIAEAGLLCAGFGDRVITTGGTASWNQLAWLLARARYYVGVDTAAMHLAAAMGCPSVTLFGKTKVSRYRPWKTSHVMVASPVTFSEQEVQSRGLPENHLMLAIGVDEVVHACKQASRMGR